jgi:hypothetical protein
MQVCGWGMREIGEPGCQRVEGVACACTEFRDEAQIGMVWSPMLIEEIIIGHLRIDRSTSFSSISLPFWVLYPKAD